MRPLTRDPFARATFTLECEPEYATIEGNASAIDDEPARRCNKRPR